MGQSMKKLEKYIMRHIKTNTKQDENLHMQLNLVKLFDLIFVKYVEILIKKYMDTITTIQNHMMSFGYAVLATDIYTEKSITVRDLMIKLLLEMRKSELPTKAEEVKSKSFARHITYNMCMVSTERESNRKQCITNDLWVQNLRSTGI